MFGKIFWSMCNDREAPEPYKDLAGEGAFVKALKELADIGIQKNVPVIVFSQEKLEQKKKILFSAL